MDFKKTILITGGAGFIGSHVVRRFVTNYPHYHIVNLDALTYAGNLDNLRDIEDKPNYTFEKGDIVDALFINALFDKYPFTGVIHLAAESHVDRSISRPDVFHQYKYYWYRQFVKCCPFYLDKKGCHCER